jgi:adenylate cyclase
VGALRVKLTPDEAARRKTHRKIDPEAYDLFVRASQNLLQFRPDALLEARAMLERAIEIDPDMAVAYARLSIVHTVEYANQWNAPRSDHVFRAVELARKAVRLDENEPRSYEALSIALFQARKPQEAEHAAGRVVELDPNYPSGYVELGNARHFKGEHNKAVAFYQQALKLDPQFDLALQFLGRALLALGRFDEAEAAFKRRLALAPRSDMTRFYLVSLYGRTGRIEEARKLWRELLEVKPDFSVRHFKQVLPYTDPAAFDWFLEGIRKAGVVIEN